MLQANTIRPHRRRRSGNAIIEFALSASVMFPVLLGVFQFGNTFYQYNNLETAIRNAARYAAVRSYDSPNASPSSEYLAAVRNMAIYGTPAPAVDAPKIVPLSTSNISVTVTFSQGVPSTVNVKSTGYSLDAVITSFALDGKPSVTFPYQGRWDPI